MPPKKKPIEEDKEATVKLPIVGEVSWKFAILIFLFLTTDPGERMLKTVGMNTQIGDIETIKTDVQEIKKQVAKITVEVGELKSLADIKKEAREAIAGNPTRGESE